MDLAQDEGRTGNSLCGLLATPWTAAYQAPLPMGFSRQEYWSGLFPPCVPAAEGRSSWEMARDKALSFPGGVKGVDPAVTAVRAQASSPRGAFVCYCLPSTLCRSEEHTSELHEVRELGTLPVTAELKQRGWSATQSMVSHPRLCAPDTEGSLGNFPSHLYHRVVSSP